MYIRAQLKQDFCENVSDISLTILGTTWMGILCLYSGILESSLVRQQRIKSLIFLMTLYLPFIMWLRMPSAAALRLSTSNTLVLASYCPMSVNTSQCYLLKRCWRWFQIKLTSTRHEIVGKDQHDDVDLMLTSNGKAMIEGKSDKLIWKLLISDMYRQVDAD